MDIQGFQHTYEDMRDEDRLGMMVQKWLIFTGKKDPDQQIA